MTARKQLKLMVIGGSAGSLSMVLKIIPLLRKDIGLAVIIVFHRKPTEDNTLIEILSFRTAYAVKEIDDKDEISPNTIYLAPPDYHVLVEKDNTLSLDASEKVNYSRPSIDVTFESAADAFGKRLLCILLSGANADGMQGLIVAKALGALVVVQDPKSAEVSYMPQQAINNVEVDLLINSNNLEALYKLLTTE